MIAVIEAYDLFEPEEHENVSREERLISFVKVFFGTENVKVERNKNIIRGRFLYKVDLNLIVNYDGSIKPLSFGEIAYILCRFCKTLRIIREGGEELAFCTVTN